MADSDNVAAKRVNADSGEFVSKKIKTTDISQDNGEDDMKSDLQGSSLVSVLNDNKSQKVLFLHGKFSKDEQKDAVFIFEKKPFDVSADGLAHLLSSETRLAIDLKNDIYATYTAQLHPSLCSVKATVIYPATQKHIEKYKRQRLVVISETEDDYLTITKPFIEMEFANNIFNIQWVYNILEHKQEQDRIIFEDSDPEIGFILLPDMKWDRKDASTLYVIAIPHKRGIKSLRDITANHLPLLKNIQNKATRVISERFGVDLKSLRFYFHYQPSYYHLHVHINTVQLDIPGTSVLKAHLLADVIENLQLQPDYYQRKTFTFALLENSKLLSEFLHATDKNKETIKEQ